MPRGVTPGWRGGCRWRCVIRISWPAYAPRDDGPGPDDLHDRGPDDLHELDELAADAGSAGSSAADDTADLAAADAAD